MKIELENCRSKRLDISWVKPFAHTVCIAWIWYFQRTWIRSYSLSASKSQRSLSFDWFILIRIWEVGVPFDVSAIEHVTSWRNITERTGRIGLSTELRNVPVIARHRLHTQLIIRETTSVLFEWTKLSKRWNLIWTGCFTSRRFVYYIY
jgi:hypothetical protein